MYHVCIGYIFLYIKNINDVGRSTSMKDCFPAAINMLQVFPPTIQGIIANGITMARDLIGIDYTDIEIIMRALYNPCKSQIILKSTVRFFVIGPIDDSI
jgi:hypothetical protein